MDAGMVRRASLFPRVVLYVALVIGVVSSVYGQGISQTPYPPSFLRTGSGLDLAPSRPLGMPGSTGGPAGGSNSVFLTNGMFRDILPLIPNLEIGYLYTFGSSIQNSRFTLDFTLPVELGPHAVVFGEVHGESTDFWKSIQELFRSGDIITGSSSFNQRTDLSVGGGYRRILNHRLMIGVNGFYDASKLGSGWYGSSGFGFEVAALGPGNDLVDLNFNYYGNLFLGSNSIVNAFRNGTGNFDVEIGYSHELLDGGPDLRLKFTGYHFNIGTRVYGWDAGAEIKTRNGMFSVRAETGRDGINGTYHTIGGFVNVGVQFDRLFTGESPFVMPEPVFASPRNLRRQLVKKVERTFFQTTPVAVARTQACTGVILATAPLDNGQAPMDRYFAEGTWSALITDDSTSWNLNPWATLSTSINGTDIDPLCNGTINISVQGDGGTFPCPGVEVRVMLRDSSSGVTSSYFQNGQTQTLQSDGVARTWVIPLSQAQLADLAVAGRTWDTISVEVRHQGGVFSRSIKVYANRTIITLGSK